MEPQSLHRFPSPRAQEKRKRIGKGEADGCRDNLLIFHVESETSLVGSLIVIVIVESAISEMARQGTAAHGQDASTT
jgi:hypothetical protein